MDVASEDEGSQDQVSQRLILGDRLLEPVEGDLQDLDVGLGDCRDVDSLARQHRQVMLVSRPVTFLDRVASSARTRRAYTPSDLRKRASWI